MGVGGAQKEADWPASAAGPLNAAARPPRRALAKGGPCMLAGRSDTGEGKDPGQTLAVAGQGRGRVVF